MREEPEVAPEEPAGAAPEAAAPPVSPSSGSREDALISELEAEEKLANSSSRERNWLDAPSILGRDGYKLAAKNNNTIRFK